MLSDSFCRTSRETDLLRKAHRPMNLEERHDFVDLVAQAVVDKMEERDRISGMVNMVVARVIEMQRAEADLQAAEAEAPAPPVHPNAA